MVIGKLREENTGVQMSRTKVYELQRLMNANDGLEVTGFFFVFQTRFEHILGNIMLKNE